MLLRSMVLLGGQKSLFVVEVTSIVGGANQVVVHC